MSRVSDYALVSQLAKTDEAGGLTKERSVLLLWFLRNSVGIDDLDAYEFVTDGDLDGGVDGLYLEHSLEAPDAETLVIYQSKYTIHPGQQGVNAIKGLIATAAYFEAADSLREFVVGGLEARLAALIAEYDLERKLDEGWLGDGRLRIRLALVTTGFLGPKGRALVDAENRTHFLGYVSVHDIDRLGSLAQAVSSRQLLKGTVKARLSKDRLIVFGSVPNRVAIAIVQAQDVVSWPGIADRKLFDLNVRRELRPNKVSADLDRAISTPTDHRDFLAYHNGLTVVCDGFDLARGMLSVTNPSIVNGVQSVVALARGSTSGTLTPDLRLVAKFVEIGGRPQLAKEVSRRSNTQNPVNARMLMANSGPQLRIEQDFARLYPDVDYQTRPDYSNVSTKPIIIANDLAAQLICALFIAKPWLAVKRLALFESDTHAMIFSERIGAPHVYIAHLIGVAVDDARAAFPAAYRASWRLTRIVAAYLVGELLRSGRELGLADVLATPEVALNDRASLSASLERAVALSAATLSMRRLTLESAGAVDDFNRDFKNEKTLRELGGKALEVLAVSQTLAGASAAALNAPAKGPNTKKGRGTARA